jgi:dihydropteridine reductase
MVSYGLSKAATHHLVATLAADQETLPRDTTVLALMPQTLDTPGNRAAMPQAAHEDWTPCAVVARRVRAWLEGEEKAPRSGSLVSIVTQYGSTRFVSYLPSVVSAE